MTLPGVVPGEQDIPDDEADQSHSSVYHYTLLMLKEAVDAWVAAWNPGNIITVDESMIHWTGTGEIHVTYLPRKPTPYGIELKGAACGSSQIMLNVEVVEGKEADAKKKYRDEVGATTSCTIRLTEPWRGTGRIVVGDSWFGSCNTAEWLMDVNGLYSIMAVKTGHKGFPKKLLVDKISSIRFSSAFMTVNVHLDCGIVPFIAAGHMDKKPMLLVGTCGMSVPGETVVRERRSFKDGVI